MTAVRIAEALLMVDGLGAFVFVVSFATLTKWWRDPVGQQVMALFIIITGLVALSIASIFIKPGPGMICIFIMGYFILGAIIWSMSIFLWITRIRSRHRKVVPGSDVDKA